MFDRLLIALDLQISPARQVLEQALSLRSEGSEIFVVHVVEPDHVQYSIDPTFTGGMTAAMEEEALNLARARIAEICEPFGIAVDHQKIVPGRAADRIHALALEHNVDTIFIGAQARSGIMRLLGSTANSVLHGAPVNVMVVHIGEAA